MVDTLASDAFAAIVLADQLNFAVWEGKGLLQINFHKRKILCSDRLQMTVIFRSVSFEHG